MSSAFCFQFDSILETLRDRLLCSLTREKPVVELVSRATQ